MASLEAVAAALDSMDKMPQWYREMTPEARKDRIKVYSVGLRDLTDAEVQTAAELAVGACKWFPVPAELKELVRPKTVQQASFRDAAEDSYSKILQQYERGENPTYTEVEEWLGRPAAQAFLAAGGQSVFEWCEPGPDQAFRQKRFIESYLLHAEAEQAQGQLEGGRQEISSGEAREMLKRIGK